MTNPARQLHEAYAHWRDLTASGGVALRQVIEPPSQEGAAEVMRVARLLARIDDILKDFEREGARVDLYRRQFPDWVTGMVSYQAGWSNPLGPDNILGVDHMDEIEGFANFLDGKVYVLGGDAETLQSLLQRAGELLSEDTELDPRLAEYIHRLLQQIRNALDDEVFGMSFDYADAVQRLWVAFRAAEGAGTERSSRWHDLWTQIGGGTVSGALVQGGTVVIQAITGIGI